MSHHDDHRDDHGPDHDAAPALSLHGHHGCGCGHAHEEHGHHGKGSHGKEHGGCGCRHEHEHEHEHEGHGHEASDGVDYSVITSCDAAIAQLEAIIAGLRSGTVNLVHEASSASLTAPLTVKLRVKAGTRGEKRRLSLKLSWHAEHEAPATPAP